MTVADLHELTALELGAAIATGDLSPVEVAAHFLDRSAADCVGAYVLVDRERTLAEATVLGSRPEGAHPLWGVPLSVKDLEPVAGQRTRFGSAAFADHVPAEDGAVVRRLRAAGMPVLGKTTTSEFGLVCYCEPDDHPAAVTPWDPNRSASGSSGGAAASVAAALAPVAHGGDGGGSIRTPASVCGVVGVKPGRGRVSDGNAAGDALGLSTIGPLARTVEDAAALLDVLVAPEPGDTDHRRSPRSWLAAAREAPSPLRIGWYVETAAGSLAHPDCVAAVESTAAALAAVGHEVERIANPFPPQFDVLFTQVWWAGAATTMLPPEVEGRLRPITRWFRARGRALTGPEALRALIGVRELGRRAVAATAHLDLVVTPTLATPPAPVGSLRHDDDPERELAALAAFTPFTPPYNASGQPAVSVPVHWTDDGLPIGVQLVGPPAGDGIVLAVARQLEQLVGWPAKRPPAW